MEVRVQELEAFRPAGSYSLGLHTQDITSYLLKLFSASFCIVTQFCYCCSVAKSELFVDPMDCSTPGLPVLHYLLGFA